MEYFRDFVNAMEEDCLRMNIAASYVEAQGEIIMIDGGTTRVSRTLSQKLLEKIASIDSDQFSYHEGLPLLENGFVLKKSFNDGDLGYKKQVLQVCINPLTRRRYKKDRIPIEIV